MARGDIKIRVEDYLALRRDSEALGRVRAFILDGENSLNSQHRKMLMDAIVDAGNIKTEGETNESK